jgi:hypothetical protein
MVSLLKLLNEAIEGPKAIVLAGGLVLVKAISLKMF